MTLTELAHKLRPFIEKAAQFLSESDSLEATQLFPVWCADTSYVKGLKLRYQDTLYVVLQDHISQSAWTPDESPSLFAKVLIPDENVTPEWEQPESTNGYKMGDKVTFDGQVYEILIDNNVWSPTAYPAGWRIVGAD